SDSSDSTISGDRRNARRSPLRNSGHPRLVSVDDVRDAYSRRAEEYADTFGSREGMPEPFRRSVSQWAGEISGRMIDAGCGPGQWTDFLRGQGCDIEGVDLVPRFIEIARSRFP